MVDRIRDGRGHASNGDLAGPAGANTHRINVRIRFIDEVNVNGVHVGIHRHGVIRQIAGDNAAVAMVIDGVFHQGHADTHDDAAIRLTAHGLLVDDSADIKGADDA